MTDGTRTYCCQAAAQRYPDPCLHHDTDNVVKLPPAPGQPPAADRLRAAVQATADRFPELYRLGIPHQVRDVLDSDTGELITLPVGGGLTDAGDAVVRMGIYDLTPFQALQVAGALLLTAPGAIPQMLEDGSGVRYATPLLDGGRPSLHRLMFAPDPALPTTPEGTQL